MEVAYVDASCLVALTFAEPGTDELGPRLTGYERLVASNLVEAELRAAVAREGFVLQPDFLDGIDWILPNRPLTIEMSAVLAAGYLRGAGLWHLACAMFVSPNARELSFLTLDRAQGAVAAALGFAVPQL